jgi:hypothetical protein
MEVKKHDGQTAEQMEGDDIKLDRKEIRLASGVFLWKQ